MAINYDTASSGGIDQQVQDKADVYANNPQALGFEYKKSGNVLDLIALARIKKDLEQKRKEVALQMQGNPKTVAEQTLDETLQLSQKDVTDQTSKLLQEKQKRAATNQQRMMGGKPPVGIPAATQRRTVNPNMVAGIGGVPPRAPVNPRGTGIASNRIPNQPYRPSGAGGGIVSFQNTGYVNPKTNRPYSPRALEMLGVTQQQWATMSDEERGARIEQFNTVNEARQSGASEREIRQMIFDSGFPLGPEQAIPGSASPENNPKNRIPVGDIENIVGTDVIPNLGKSTYNLYPNKAIGSANTSTEDLNPEPEDGQSTFERIENIKTPPLDIYSMPKDTGQVDTTGIPGEYKGDDLTLPSQTPEGIELKDRQDLLFEQQSTVLDQDPSKQRGAAAAWADEQTGKAGIADANTRLLQERKDMIAAGDRARVGSGLYDLLARAGGQGALANIGRAAADKRYQGLLRDERQLMGTQEAERYGLEQLRMAGEKAVDAGMKAQELSSAEKRTAATQMAEILKQQGDNLSEEALLVLRQRSDNMSEHAANRRARITIATENASAELQKGIHELNGKLTTQTNEIRRDAVDSDNLRTVQTGVIEAAKNAGLIKAKVGTAFAKVIQNDPTYMQLNNADQKEGTNKAEAYLKKQRIIWDKMADNLVSELVEIQRQGNHKYNILMEQIVPTGGVQVTGIAGQT